MMKKGLYILIILMLFFSCTVTNMVQQGETTGGGGNGSNLTEVKTVYWQETNGEYIQLYTNYVGDKDRSFYHFKEETETMDSFEAEVVKVSGYGSGGAGVLFCASKDSDGLITGYTVSIDTSGSFTVRAIKDGKITTIIPWQANAHINTGYNQKNKIRVEYKGSNQFELSFNGFTGTDEKVTFPENPSEYIQLTGGFNGYCAGVSQLESFPSTAVDVRFK